MTIRRGDKHVQRALRTLPIEAIAPTIAARESQADGLWCLVGGEPSFVPVDGSRTVTEWDDPLIYAQYARWLASQLERIYDTHDEALAFVLSQIGPGSGVADGPSVETLWYAGPSGGEWVPSPTAEQIVERMRRGSEYWGSFGPTGVLKWHEHPPQPSPTRYGLGTMTSRQQLILNRHPERGWYFEYSTENISPRRWLVPFDRGADWDEYFPQWTTGETQMFLAGCFIPQAVAEWIVSDFITTREPSPAVQWVPFNDVVPRIHADDLKKRRRQG